MAEGSCFCERVVDEVLIGALSDRGRGMVLGTKVVDGDGDTLANHPSTVVRCNRGATPNTNA